MKKILVILCLSFLLAGNSFAGCKKDLKFTWYKERGTGKVFFNFKNNGKKHIRITFIEVFDSDNDEVLEFKPTGYNYSNSGSNGVFVGPGSERKISRINSHAHKYGKKASMDCSYQKPYETSIGDKADNVSGAVSDFFSDLFSKDKDD